MKMGYSGVMMVTTEAHDSIRDRSARYSALLRFAACRLLILLRGPLRRISLVLVALTVSQAAFSAITLKESTWNTYGYPPIIGAGLYVPQAAGDFIVVIIGWNDSTSQVVSVTDTMGNTYVRAVGPTIYSGNVTQSIYYAKNVAATAGPNGVTVTFDNASVQAADLRIAVYSGVDTVNPFDGGTGAFGDGTSMDSGSITTTNANDLLIAGNYIENTTTSVGSGFTQQALSDLNQFIADKVVTSVGSYNATATQDVCCYWVLQMAAFKAAATASTSTPLAPPTNLTVTAASSKEIDISWTASTSAGVTGYLIERCQGTGCSSFSQVGSVVGVTYYYDAGLAANTSYVYRIRAIDGAGNPSEYSTSLVASTLSTASCD